MTPIIAIVIFIFAISTSKAQFEAVTDTPTPFPSASPSVSTISNSTGIQYPRVVLYSIPAVSTVMITWVATMTMIFSLCGARRDYTKLQNLKRTLAQYVL